MGVLDQINLKGFINEGSIIRTKHSEHPNWVTNLVYRVNEDCIEIDTGLERTYIENLIMVGDNIKCKYTTSDSEYTLLGVVIKIKADYPESITIRIYQMEKFKDKRDSLRFDVYLSSVIRKSIQDNKGIFAIMINLSRNGAAFVVREEFEKLFDINENNIGDTNIFFDVYIAPKRLLTLEGIIIWKNKKERGVEYGVKIVDMDIQNEKKLSEFLNELEKKDKEFYNKRSGRNL